MRYVSPLLVFIVSTAWGAATTLEGIDSFAIGLTGNGIAIGEADPLGRSSKAGFDSAVNSASNTIPTGVYTQGGSGGIITAGPNDGIDMHATLVAEMMIGSFGSAPYDGVAPQAQLHSLGLFFAFDDNLTALGFNQLATLNVGTKVRAINLSFGVPLEFFESPDGSSHITQFVDWSARRHDVLYAHAAPGR